MNYRGWTVEKPVDVIRVGTDLVPLTQGDHVIVIVVKRYDDTAKALEVVRQLTALEPEE